MNQETANKKKGRLTLILILAVFALPILSSWLMVSGKIGWKPQEFANHGILIQPAVNIGDYINQADGPQRLQVNYGNWLLGVYIPGKCAESCQQKLQEIRQVHLSLGREVNRLTRFLILTGPLHETTPGIQQAAARFEEMSVFVNNEPSLRQKLEALRESAPQDEVIAFVIDGLGNIILLYTQAHEGRGLQKDLGRLLRGSRTE